MNNNAFLRLARVLVVIGFTGLSLNAIAARPVGGGHADDFGKPLSAKALAGYRGGYEVQMSNASLDARLTNNQAQDNATGTNMVTSQAFSGASGIPTVIQNSGNNVIIQNSTILNVEMR